MAVSTPPPRCHYCQANDPDRLVWCELDRPAGWVWLCGECIAAADEGRWWRPWAARPAANKRPV